MIKQKPFLILACGALAKEIIQLLSKHKVLFNLIDIQCLSASYHNNPAKIAPELEILINKNIDIYEDIFVAYADCGTGFKIDNVINKYNIKRLPGAHCYEFFATRNKFNKITEDSISSFFLTDYLVKNFDRLVYKTLGLDKYPELLTGYFGNYTKVVYLMQIENINLINKAKEIAKKLNLKLQIEKTGFGDLKLALDYFVNKIQNKNTFEIGIKENV